MHDSRSDLLTLWDPLLEAPFFRDLVEHTGRREHGFCLTGLVTGSRALIVGLLVARTGNPVMVVLPDDAAVEAFRRDLSALSHLVGLDPQRIVTMPALDADPYGAIPPHSEVLHERTVALEKLLDHAVDVLLVPVRSLLQWLPPVEDWSSWRRVVREGANLPPDRFVLEALGLGYRRVDTVCAPGEVSRRGGNIDIFPPTAQEPVRIELFGDTVDSLRSFDTDHQRSTGQLDEVVVGPAVENPPTEQAVERLTNYLEAGRRQAAGDDATIRRLRARLDQLREHGYFPGLETLARLSVSRPTPLVAYAEQLLWVVDEPERTDDELIRAAHELGVHYEQSKERVLPPPRELFVDPQEIRSQLKRATLVLRELAGVEQADTAGKVRHVNCRPARSYAGRVKELTADLRRARERATRTLCVMRAKGGAERLVEIFREYGLESVGAESPLPPGSRRWPAGGLFVGVGALRAGYEFPDLGLTVLCEREVFGEQRKTAARKHDSRAVFISDFRDLKIGDLVVHVDHGVARYTGLGRPKGGSLNRDFMVLEFAGSDRLFAPVDRLDLVQRSSGVAGGKPSLDRLGGPGWERVKARVRKSVCPSRMRGLLSPRVARRVRAAPWPSTAPTCAPAPSLAPSPGHPAGPATACRRPRRCSVAPGRDGRPERTIDRHRRTPAP